MAQETQEAAAALSQVEGAMEAYLALGEETPLANEIQSMLDTVRGALSELRSSESEEPSVEEGEAGSEPETSSPSDFRGATRAARDALRNGTLGGERGETKAPEGEQSPDEEEEEKRKRTKASSRYSP